MSKLGAVEVPERIKSGLKLYEHLEGVRKTEKLVDEAARAYLKVLAGAIDKDETIQGQLATETKPRKGKPVVEMPGAEAPQQPTKKVAIAS